MSNTRLIIDNREKDLKAAFKNAEYKNLDIGDIQINYNKDGKDEIFLLIERKTMEDLIASVNDGRYREQKKRLIESGIPKERIMYLLEGSSDDIPGHFKTLFGMIINTLFRDQLKVFRVMDVEETIFFIKRIIDKLNQNDTDILNHIKTKNNTQNTQNTQETSPQDTNNNTNNNITNTNSNNTNLEYLSTIKLKKKDNLTVYHCSLLQLAQIPGMSIHNANRILEKYGSIANLVKSYYEIDEEDKRAKMLIDLVLDEVNGKKRRLGPSLSSKVYKFLFNTDKEER